MTPPFRRKVDITRQRNYSRHAHGYAVTDETGGVYRRKPAESPQAVIACVRSFGRCATCQRRQQELVNERCYMCRALGFGG